MYHIANYHESGLGVSKDREAARDLYRRAAEAGFEVARAELEVIEMNLDEYLWR